MGKKVLRNISFTLYNIIGRRLFRFFSKCVCVNAIYFGQYAPARTLLKTRFK